MRGEGWVLWQLITTSDGAKVAVAILYGSRKYSDTERKWETTRQEATAIRSALEDVEEYVFGRHFFLFSDHLNLRFMHNSVNRAVLRMRDFLAQFDMTVVHCPGVWNNADAISRLEIDQLPKELATDMNSARRRTDSGKRSEVLNRNRHLPRFALGIRHCTQTQRKGNHYSTPYRSGSIPTLLSLSRKLLVMQQRKLFVNQMQWKLKKPLQA